MQVKVHLKKLLVMQNTLFRVLYGSSAELIHEVPFNNAINISISVTISNPVRVESDVMNAPDMETALMIHRRKNTVVSREVFNSKNRKCGYGYYITRNPDPSSIIW
jgi:hypothetical protein